MKKAVCGILALATTLGSGVMLTACETSHPEVEMTLSFEGETYTLEYQLYRKIAPRTVEHFITLVENGYYNGLCVHNYAADSARMYTGAYTYDEDLGENGNLVYKQYYDVVSQYENFPVSVYADAELTQKTYNLYGEFPNNGVVVENGRLSQSFGSLTMYYTEKDVSKDVFPLRNDGKTPAAKEYSYNCATSLFYISTMDAGTTSQYCTFATLEDGEDELEALQEAIGGYMESLGDEEEDQIFVNSVKIKVDTDDAYVTNPPEITYNIPVSPIVITSMKVTKY